GVGEDISFDLALIGRFGCTVHAFDPVPAAARHAHAAAAYEPRHVFHPFGVWSSDTTLEFHEPEVHGFVSHSATNLHGTRGAFTAQVRSVGSLMAELGHDHIDLLKVSAEGSEYEIVRDVLDSGVSVRVLCVEISQPAPRGAGEELIALIGAAGWSLA